MEDESHLVDNLISLQNEIEVMIGNFDDDLLAQNVRIAFSQFIHPKEKTVATLLARYLDHKLRAGNTALTDAELADRMDNALVIFRTLSSKDVFEAVFTRLFARRILLRRSASSDSERAMLERLRGEYGPDFVARLEAMLRDIELSDELMGVYPGVQVSAAGSTFNFEVSVLTHSHWPTFKDVNVNLPDFLANAHKQFESFYQTRYSGRTIHWNHNLGSCVLNADLGRAGTRILHLSALQALVLLLFNDATVLSYEDIQKATMIEPAELKRTLQSLACGTIPTRVLRKQPQGRDVDNTDTFRVNENLQNNHRRIRINEIQMQDTPEEHREVEHRVVIDRDLLLQAAAMRVLKARKRIEHNDLVTEVVAQTRNRFSVEISELKKAFERLIEKDFMERDKHDHNIYLYVA
ncbi:hypothetical protein MCUN1_002093 [Malassezia cuniculi]|uniref:Cullin family profile domain-containing protein n=1 Tax=Malassezia cuniculi TaxID=948313 RepID=A0AAF0EYW0_9BASI|nr:hypothetical protein MCUN1_002093 [Malassezia cuniculi]